MGRQQFR